MQALPRLRNDVSPFTLMTGSLLLCSLIAWSSASAFGSQSSEGAPRIVCSLDHPVVDTYGSVTATALADASGSQSLQYHWKAEGGSFVAQSPDARTDRSAAAVTEATGSTVEWVPHGTHAGSYTLRATVRDMNGLLGTCALSVVVAQKQRSIGNPSAPAAQFDRGIEGALLIKDRSERKGYGLYSYLVIAAPPVGSDKERVQKFIQTYLDQILAVKALESYFKSSQLNLTYLPVDSEPSDKVTVDWVLDHYDYARAQFLLASFPEKHGSGPFIVSALHPVGGPGTVTGHYVFEDLSSVPPSAIQFWIQQFMSQTAQERFWQPNTLDAVALRLRTAISIAAAGLPDVRNAVASWIVIGPGQ